MSDATAAARQSQFLTVLSRAEAEARFRAHVRMTPLGPQTVALGQARGRVLATDVLAPVDVPGFDRASVDGFAIRAADSRGATPAGPAPLRLNTELLTPGVQPQEAVAPGTATVIATGGMVPRGADAVVMLEQTDLRGGAVDVHAPTVAGAAIAGAGSDIARGETVLRAGRVLGSREIGMLAAVGLGMVRVWRRPRVAVFSTGNEIVAPGGPIRPGQVYDSNAAILCAAVEELGGEAVPLGIVADDAVALQAMLEQALALGDVVVLSGGTSKGAGDIAAQVVGRLRRPGVVVHGVALKPGKPLCLAVQDGVPVAVLPGFPTSAIFTFHEFVAPVIRAMAGLPQESPTVVDAVLPVRIASERGRTEYVMVSLMADAGGAEAGGADAGGYAAYPTAKGSGAVTGFAQADGFFAVPAMTEAVAAGTAVRVQLIGTGVAAADLVVIGSHCTGLDAIITLLDREGVRVKALAVGSQGGLAAAQRGACDLAGIHLLDPASGRYNAPFVTEGLTLVPGYGRRQGVVVRPDDERFEGCTAGDAMAVDARMVNRNAGSGTRILTDMLLCGRRPEGYAHQPRSHNAVAAAVAQGRADWGVAIESVGRAYGLRFLPLRAEQYDFVVPTARLQRAPVRRFLALLRSDAVRGALREQKFTP